MRSIDKGTEPQALRQWKRQNQDTPQNLHYDNLPSDIRDAVKEALLREQGGLAPTRCAGSDSHQAATSSM